MFKKRLRRPSGTGAPRRFRASGLTLVSITISGMVAGIILAGGWMSYASMLRQWKIANAEREMDQYAHAAMQELTNDLSWSWGGQMIVGGSRNMRWKFQFDDKIEEEGLMTSTRLGQLRDPNKFVVINYHPTLGIMVGGQVPKWAGDRWHPQYRWVGTAPHRNDTKSFDHRDRMTVEGFSMDWSTFGDRWHTSSIAEGLRRRGVVNVQLTLQYIYRGSFPRSDLGLYGGYYIKERQYNTQISLKNWDTDGNAFKDSLLAHAG